MHGCLDVFEFGHVLGCRWNKDVTVLLALASKGEDPAKDLRRNALNDAGKPGIAPEGI